MNPTDWRRHAALLDQQPNNRRFAQQRTPRTLREAGLSEQIDDPLASFERVLATAGWIAAAVVVSVVLWY
jgi:hypothetical protein